MKNKISAFTVNNQRGAVAVTVALLMIMLVGFAALAIDVGYVYVTRNELQNVADAAALAATRELGFIYQGMSYDEQQNFSCASIDVAPCSQIVAVAKQAALENQAANVNIVINDSDVQIGHWDFSVLPPFTAGNDPMNIQPGNLPDPNPLVRPKAVRVTARRQEGSNSPITMFLAGVIGVDTMGVSALATAALSGQATAGEGDLQLPVGISRWFFDQWDDTAPGYCDDEIAFSPANSPDSCAGWTSWNNNANDNMLRNILEGPLEEPPTYLSPTIGPDDVTSVNFIGGDLSVPTFDDLLTLFQYKGVDVDLDGNPVPLCDRIDSDPADVNSHHCDDDHTTRLLYPDGEERNLHEWETAVVVYDSDDCSNPNQSIAVKGFATVLLTEVLGPPSKSIKALVQCNYVQQAPAHGGGSSYGTFGSIPGLVQ
ncbi:MAG: hypothetical protein KAT62_04565 [Desulfuromonadales bacterium]|nr:hypothetical protein [Desulfuromonadales bacterium]